MTMRALIRRMDFGNAFSGRMECGNAFSVLEDAFGRGYAAIVKAFRRSKRYATSIGANLQVGMDTFL